MRTAVFTDNDFDKVNGVTTTWRAVLGSTAGSGEVRLYTASDVSADLPGYFAVASAGCGMPWYRDMRVYVPRLRQFAAQLRRDGIDVIHVATPGPVGLAGRWLARRMGLPLVGSYHTHLGDYVEALSGSTRLGRAFDAYMRWFYGPCRTLLVPSRTTLDLLAGVGYPRAQLRVWPRGVDTAVFAPSRASAEWRRAWRVDERRPALLYAGRLSAEKGLSLIEPLQRALHRHAVAHRLVFVGDGPMAGALRRRCPDALFLGTLAHRDVAVAMASSDVFLFPSATDTFGNVVLEALASGLPAVVTDRGGPCEQVAHDVTGFVCRAGDVDDFARRTSTLLRGKARRRVMSAAARDQAMERGWDAALAPLLSAWREARTGTPVAGPTTEMTLPEPSAGPVAR